MTKRRDILFSIAAAGLLAFAGTSATAASIGSSYSPGISQFSDAVQTGIQRNKRVHKAHHSKFRKYRQYRKHGKSKRHFRRHHRLHHAPRFLHFKHYRSHNRFSGKRHFHRPFRYPHRPHLHFGAMRAQSDLRQRTWPAPCRSRFVSCVRGVCS